MIAVTSIYKRSCRLMGNRFEISVLGDDREWADEMIDGAIAEIQRIERLLTTFENNSETNLINKNAGIAPVAVDREVYDLIQRSIRLSELTQGAFDITYGSIDKRLWNFDEHMTQLPDKETAKNTVRLINYRNIICDSETCTVFLKEKGMRIGFGGIGKGYAADRAKQVLKAKGVHSGLVNASGDLTTWGLQPNGKPWTIAIADPNTANTVFSYMDISDMAVATSGNYEKFVIIGGIRYSHTINPRTGFPVTGVKSVTIITPIAELADAIATPVTVMGVNAGLDMINQMKNIEAIIIDDDDRLFTSKNIKINN